jgi:S1-C subfamily serine protease
MRVRRLHSLLTFAFCALTFDFVFPADTKHRDFLETDAGRAVVQLVAIGPGAAAKNLNCSSTGFFINEEGYLLTNAHVVEEAQRCLAGAPEGRILVRFPAPDSSAAVAVSCEIVSVDEAHDLALLKATRRHPQGVPYYSAPLVPEGIEENARLTVTGHPSAAWNAVTRSSRVVRLGRMRLGASGGERSDILVLALRLERGASGSPVYDARGVVGVITRRHPAGPGRTVAVSIRHAIQLLDREGVVWRAARNPPKGE